MPQAMTVDSAFNLFTRPRRHPLTETEATLLADAAHSFVHYRGEKLALWSWGRGPVVLLVHGWEGRGSHFQFFVSPLRSKGFRVVAMDCPAHGESSGTTSSVPDFAGAVIGVGNALGDIAAVVGHSAGSAASVYAFTQGLQPRCSVHLSGPCSFERGVERFASFVALTGTDRAEFRRRVEAFIGMSLSETDLAKLRLPDRPALLLHDPADKEVSFSEAELLVAAWPSATLQAVSDVGHRRILQSDVAVELTARFISTHVSGHGREPSL